MVYYNNNLITGFLFILVSYPHTSALIALPAISHLHNLPTSVIGRVFSPFCKGFIFAKHFTKIKPLRINLCCQYSELTLNIFILFSEQFLLIKCTVYIRYTK